MAEKGKTISDAIGRPDNKLRNQFRKGELENYRIKLTIEDYLFGIRAHEAGKKFVDLFLEARDNIKKLGEKEPDNTPKRFFLLGFYDGVVDVLTDFLRFCTVGELDQIGDSKQITDGKQQPTPTSEPSPVNLTITIGKFHNKQTEQIPPKEPSVPEERSLTTLGSNRDVRSALVNIGGLSGNIQLQNLTQLPREALLQIPLNARGDYEVIMGIYRRMKDVPGWMEAYGELLTTLLYRKHQQAEGLGDRGFFELPDNNPYFLDGKRGAYKHFLTEVGLGDKAMVIEKQVEEEIPGQIIREEKQEIAFLRFIAREPELTSDVQGALENFISRNMLVIPGWERVLQRYDWGYSVRTMQILKVIAMQNQESILSFLQRFFEMVRDNFVILNKNKLKKGYYEKGITIVEPASDSQIGELFTERRKSSRALGRRGRRTPLPLTSLPPEGHNHVQYPPQDTLYRKEFLVPKEEQEYGMSIAKKGANTNMGWEEQWWKERYEIRKWRFYMGTLIELSKENTK